MKQLSSLVAAGAGAVLALGIGAAGASAYSISGGAYTGTATVDHTWTYGGSTVVICPTSGTTYSGTATGADTTTFTPGFGGAGSCEFFGLPASVTQSGAWSLKVIAGPDGNGYYEGRLDIPVGTTTITDIPTGSCLATVGGAQAFQHPFSGTTILMRNAGPDLELVMSLSGITYTGSGLCFPPGLAVYSTNGVVLLPGVTIS
ncbi:MAG: hypothetical protein ITG02_11665 [Patulibacter sp.]|nr:hypothetical protein [Patulibacter sp.]